MRDVEVHQEANRGYIEGGIELLERAQRANELFQTQPPRTIAGCL
jgi:hypothetical protein